VELPNGLKMGTVKFFGQRDKYGGLFGFLYYYEGSEEYQVFFHESSGETFSAGQDWHGRPCPEFAGEKQLRRPIKGDRIVFFMSYADFSAGPWGFADEYESIKKQMESQRLAATV